MEKNMGLVDRVIRVLVAVVIAWLYVGGAIDGWPALVLGLVAVVFVVTAAMGFCPSYVPFKISTRGK
jgi:fatty acid desaturase